MNLIVFHLYGTMFTRAMILGCDKPCYYEDYDVDVTEWNFNLFNVSYPDPSGITLSIKSTTRYVKQALQSID